MRFLAITLLSMKNSFDPRVDLPYPEFTDGHYRPIEKDDGTVFDKDYPYVDKSKAFLRQQKVVRLLLRLLVFPFSYVRMGLVIKGKNNIRKNRDLLKKGALSLSNHVNTWDYIAIMNAIKPFKPYVLVLKENISGESGSLVRKVGGIPIPENDFKATKAYLLAIQNLLSEGGWLHIYPEGSMWEYYRPIRPFKRGVASLARITGKPIVPIAFSYRKPSWIRKRLFKQKACFTLSIGELLFVDKTIESPAEQEIDLLSRCHKAVVSLAELSEEEDVYEAVFNHSKRVDY